MATLFEITADLRRIDELLIEREGDLTGIEQEVTAWLSQLQDDLTTKVDNYAALISELEARSAVRAGEAARLTKLSKLDADAAKYLKDRLKIAFQARNITRLDTPRFRVGVQKNGGIPPLFVDPLATLPDEFMRTIPETRLPDSDRIREALNAGQEVPGCRLGERGTRLTIK